jgi:hypothetical protein
MQTLVALASLMAAAAAVDKEQLTRDERALREAGVETTGPGLLAFFRQHTASAADTDTLRQLIKDLGDDSFKKRERASARLTAIGSRAVPLLREATSHRDIEVVARARRCLSEIKLGSVEALLSAAARLIAERKPTGATRVLLDYLALVEDEDLAEEVQKTLAALALPGGKPDAALVAALAAKAPRVRIGAAVALTRAGAAKDVPGVSKLLRDPEARVRLRVGLALAAARDRDAVPVLIALLGELPAEETADIEELLASLAGDKAPTASPGTTPASRREYRAAWEGWYRAHKDQVTAERLAAAFRPRDRTLIVLLNAGRVIDVDAGGKTLWQVEGLKFPLDAQYLPGDRVLVAEYEGGRVSERNRKGEVVWEKKVLNPIVAQRLPNGNTFIATSSRLLEVDPSGREVWEQPPPQRGRVMKALRLRNGDVAVVTMLGGSRFFVIDREGTIRHSFGVELSTSGGRLDVLRNGHVLIPERGHGRVAEYDKAGKVVWQARFTDPVAAVRVARGNVLVTGMNSEKAVELDRKGKVVWEHKADGRLTRAWRH